MTSRQLKRALAQVLEQHSATNLELGLKGGANVIGLKRGDYVQVIARYHDSADVGKQARVVKAWVTPDGNELARLHFGKNLGGQNLRGVYPANVLKKIPRPTGQWVDRLKASTDQRRVREQATLTKQTVFQVMGMLRSAKGMLVGTTPQGTEGLIKQARDSIESAHWKLNSTTGRFSEAIQWQPGKNSKAVMVGSDPRYPGYRLAMVKVGSGPYSGQIVKPGNSVVRFTGYTSSQALEKAMADWLEANA